MNSRMSVSSCSVSYSTSAADCMAAAVSRRRRANSLRRWSVRRREANLNQPAARIFGNAFPRPLKSCREQGFLNGVLGGGEVAEAADDCAEHLRRKLAQQMLGLDVE